MQLLFTADDRYAVHIPAVLKSIRNSNPKSEIDIFLMTGGIQNITVNQLEQYCAYLGCSFSLVRVPADLFAGAPVNRHYSQAMYYRLLAAEALPESLPKVLYLDPDILVINSLDPLWNTDLDGYCFAAASHLQEAGVVDNINRIRLENSSLYFNTGVMLMNLESCREKVKKEDIYSFIADDRHHLLLPDQDVFNALYGKYTLEIQDEIWNYDARRFSQYLLKSGGVIDENWILDHTAILHYCGKEKPWHRHYRYRFGSLYRHYEHLAAADCEYIQTGRAGLRRQ